MSEKNNIEKRISELENWLRNHPEHPDYALILKDKRELEAQLITI